MVLVEVEEVHEEDDDEWSDNQYLYVVFIHGRHQCEQLDNTLIITINWSGRRNRNFHVLEKTTQPNKLSSSVNKNTVFRLNARTSNNHFLLTLPTMHHLARRNQCICKTACSICIRISTFFFQNYVCSLPILSYGIDFDELWMEAGGVFRFSWLLNCGEVIIYFRGDQ